MLYFLIALTSAFLIQIGNVYVSNILFLALAVIRIIAGKTRLTFDKKTMRIFAGYIIWIVFSMLLFYIQYLFFETRNVIQFSYNLFYLILIFDELVDKEKLKKALYICSYFSALYIIFLWVYLTNMRSIPDLIVNYREWAENNMGGWPNSTVLPLIFGIYIECKSIFREKKYFGIFRITVLLFALLLCTSRTGYIGAAVIIGYFFFKEKEGTNPWWKILKHFVLIICCSVVVLSVISYIINNDMTGRMFMISDRTEIISDILDYSFERPLTGYGGNSVDVVYNIVRPTISGMNWGHTHNTILELLIRHGIVGTLLFIFLIISISKKIIIKEDKMMYWIMWGLSIFQIFYKDFVFLIILYLMIPNDDPLNILNEEGEYSLS